MREIMELDPQKLAQMIAIGDAHLAVLRSSDPLPLVDESLEAQIAQLEARLDQQDHVLRHMMTMLIEWFEAENSSDD